MNQQLRILNLLSEFRNSYSLIEEIFTNGSCMNLFCILHAIYPQAKAWYNIDHIITEIDGKFYDITGNVNNRGYRPFVEFYSKRRLSRAFVQMYKENYATNK